MRSSNVLRRKLLFVLQKFEFRGQIDFSFVSLFPFIYFADISTVFIFRRPNFRSITWNMQFVCLTTKNPLKHLHDFKFLRFFFNRTLVIKVIWLLTHDVISRYTLWLLPFSFSLLWSSSFNTFSKTVFTSVDKVTRQFSSKNMNYILLEYKTSI